MHYFEPFIQFSCSNAKWKYNGQFIKYCIQFEYVYSVKEIYQYHNGSNHLLSIKYMSSKALIFLWWLHSDTWILIKVKVQIRQLQSSSTLFPKILFAWICYATVAYSILKIPPLFHQASSRQNLKAFCNTKAPKITQCFISVVLL